MLEVYIRINENRSMRCSKEITTEATWSVEKKMAWIKKIDNAGNMPDFEFTKRPNYRCLLGIFFGEILCCKNKIALCHDPNILFYMESMRCSEPFNNICSTRVSILLGRRSYECHSSLTLCEATWWLRPWSILAQVADFCLMAPSHETWEQFHCEFLGYYSVWWVWQLSF